MNGKVNEKAITVITACINFKVFYNLPAFLNLFQHFAFSQYAG
jgi:hypothetical protein